MTVASDVHIDRRVELMSIVCALAGFKEYTLGRVNPYRTEMVAAFRGFVQHPAVVMARDLRAKYGIGYDAPMILAVHLDDQLALRNAAELPLLDREVRRRSSRSSASAATRPRRSCSIASSAWASTGPLSSRD